MTELVMTRLYELMIILYALCIVLYFTDYLYKNVKLRRVAFWFVSIVWILQILFLVLFIFETKRFPILSLYEGVFFYAWLLTTLSIVLHCIARVDLPVFFINVLSFIFMTIHLFAPQSNAQIVGDSLVSEMLLIHISFAIMSYAAFSVAFVFSLLYLILYRILKRKKLNNLWARLPSLQQMVKWINLSTIIGIPLLLISLILGLEWAFLTLENVSIFDVKILGSFIVSVIYLIIFLLHQRGRLVGTTYAQVHVGLFLLVVINFFLGSKLSNFHLWV
ncbi:MULTISPECIES: cytochrome c biogenesis protein CcsA [Solibacillus]|uniref:Cytochrome c biogenesis protein CcsA n=1 Tax=Solibacillus merdavium TaxID=2762218 RepID=A0ABR8XJN9_9BACL|nr:cytochrome c biogenesis protein CcsA [Solibacillus merdavium]MBD8032126.1 cytochrome c biogenesis protein CcsA [Solibacillus merdavium]